VDHFPDVLGNGALGLSFLKGHFLIATMRGAFDLVLGVAADPCLSMPIFVFLSMQGRRTMNGLWRGVHGTMAVTMDAFGVAAGMRFSGAMIVPRCCFKNLVWHSRVLSLTSSRGLFPLGDEVRRGGRHLFLRRVAMEALLLDVVAGPVDLGHSMNLGAVRYVLGREGGIV